MMRRREIIGLLGGAATAWPLIAARAQQGERVRRVGVLSGLGDNDPEGRARIAAFQDELQKLGWTAGRNLELDVRWAAANAEHLQTMPAELVKLAPDVILASATVSLAALRRATSTIPIVFAQVTDPVGAGFVKSLARPGGNITGFTQHEFSISVKWLELLKELAPRTERVAVMYDPANPANAGYLQTMSPYASTFAVELSRYPVRDAAEIERAIGSIADKPHGGLVVLPGTSSSLHRNLVIALAERNRLPAVYAFRYWPASGGLASYGIDNIDLHRRAATYVDRILKGATPAELPVQHATKFELVVNVKTAKALGIDLPITLLARTDEVIE
jgi:putative tryptophan/tyrosine transport system substrate-binding protein